jgi:hypothetical protein
MHDHSDLKGVALGSKGRLLTSLRILALFDRGHRLPQRIPARPVAAALEGTISLRELGIVDWIRR